MVKHYLCNSKGRDRIIPKNYFYVCFPSRGEERGKMGIKMATSSSRVALEKSGTSVGVASSAPSNMSRITRPGVTRYVQD